MYMWIEESLIVPLAAAAGLIIGALVTWLLVRSRYRAQRELALAMQRAESQLALATQTSRLEEVERLAASRLEAQERALQDVLRITGEVDRAREVQANLRVDVERLTQQLKAEQQSAAERLKVLTDAQDNLKDQFKSLAAEILDASSKRLQEQSQTSLATLLDPLKQKLTDFQKKVEDVYVDESKERSALKQQVESLVGLNQQLSEDAKNLTAALRGSAKSQGSWGELILERVLEASGLRRGEEYLVQDSRTNEDGQRLQPDVVIRLPEGRHLVVDSKVSLVAYERLASAESDADRDGALREHLLSVRTHMRGLSAKDYASLYGTTLDFVLMFVPIEPAFMTAVTADTQLFMQAWERNVLLVSPSTLLFVVRTVAHLWRQEAQSRNAQEIAKRGAELFDRLTAFVEDLDAVGKRLEQAQQAFVEAKRKLSTNRGNVIRQAEMLRELGVKPSKRLPESWVAPPDEPLDALPPDEDANGNYDESSV
jgi:DNA recombination protein RmuC